MPRDDESLMSVAELTSARQVEAAAARKLGKQLVKLAQELEAEDADSESIEAAEADVLYCYRIYRTSMLHRRAVYDA